MSQSNTITIQNNLAVTSSGTAVAVWFGWGWHPVGSPFRNDDPRLAPILRAAQCQSQEHRQDWLAHSAAPLGQGSYAGGPRFASPAASMPANNPAFPQPGQFPAGPHGIYHDGPSMFGLAPSPTSYPVAPHRQFWGATQAGPAAMVTATRPSYPAVRVPRKRSSQSTPTGPAPKKQRVSTAELPSQLEPDCGLSKRAQALAIQAKTADVKDGITVRCLPDVSRADRSKSNWAELIGQVRAELGSTGLRGHTLKVRATEMAKAAWDWAQQQPIDNPADVFFANDGGKEGQGKATPADEEAAPASSMEATDLAPYTAADLGIENPGLESNSVGLLADNSVPPLEFQGTMASLFRYPHPPSTLDPFTSSASDTLSPDAAGLERQLRNFLDGVEPEMQAAATLPVVATDKAEGEAEGHEYPDEEFWWLVD